MPKFDLTRRAFVASAAALPLAFAADDWVELFDGRSHGGLDVPASTRIPGGSRTARWLRMAAGRISSTPDRCTAPTSRISNWKWIASPAPTAIRASTSTRRIRKPTSRSRASKSRSTTPSSARAATKSARRAGRSTACAMSTSQFIPDDTWFKIRVAVRGKNVQIRLNDLLVVDYTEPTPPVIPRWTRNRRASWTAARSRCSATTTGRWRASAACASGRCPTICPRPAALRPWWTTPSAPSSTTGRHNIPMVDYHVHLKQGLTLEQALAKSRRDGIEYGIAVNCGKGFPVENDAAVRAFFDCMKGQPCFIAMQAEGREWTQMFSPKRRRCSTTSSPTP